MADTAYTPAQLRYAATARCRCGAGFAYPFEHVDLHGSWTCSALLTGEATNPAEHDEALPFAFYEVKSEDQPSANGRTTRPDEPRGQREMHRQIQAYHQLTALVGYFEQDRRKFVAKAEDLLRRTNEAFASNAIGAGDFADLNRRIVAALSGNAPASPSPEERDA